MDINEAVFMIAQTPLPGDTDTQRIQAVETLLEALHLLAQDVRTLKKDVQTLTKENEALKRVGFLLTESLPDIEKRNEIHATYTQVAAGLE